jgi:hypothetical protein
MRELTGARTLEAFWTSIDTCRDFRQLDYSLDAVSQTVWHAKWNLKLRTPQSPTI